MNNENNTTFVKVVNNINKNTYSEVKMEESFNYYMEAICTFGSDVNYFDISDRADTLVDLLHSFDVNYGSHLILNLPNYVTSIFEKHLSSVGYFVYYEVPHDKGVSLICVSNP